MKSQISSLLLHTINDPYQRAELLYKELSLKLLQTRTLKMMRYATKRSNRLASDVVDNWP